MKRFFTPIIILFILSTSGCSKFLDPQPTDFVTPNNYYQTKEELNSALAAVYDLLGHNNLYAYRVLGLNGLEGDDGYYARANGIGPKTHNFSTSDNEVTVFWGILYVAIGRANMLLQNVDKNPDIDQEFRNVVRGEALFLRAYYYFLLTQTYGDIPLLLSPIASANNVEMPVTPTVEVYNQVIKDMIEAEKLVLPIQQLGSGGRITKSAVRGILARVNLTMAGYPIRDATKYAEASKWAKMVMDDAGANHRLNPSFSKIFINYAQDLYDPGESIWEVEFWGNATSGINEAGYVGSVNGPASTNTATGTAAGLLRVTSRLYNLYDDADQRKFWSIAHFRYAATGASGTKNFINVTSQASRYTLDCGKFRREYELVSPKVNNVNPQNFPILRYSDVLLMYAEAENEINGLSTEAIEAIEELRMARWSRSIKSVTITSGGSGYTSAPTVTFTGGGGSGATATATISAGRVTGVTFANDALTGTTRGNSYTSAPTITFSGGGGSGAAATVIINSPEEARVPAAAKTSPETLGQFIKDERSRELCFEGHRKHDLIRWGIFVESMQNVGDVIAIQYPTLYALEYFKNVEEKHLLWPIPAEEVTLNRALKQNPGW